MAEVPREQRKLKRWRRRDLNTNLLQVCRELKPRALQGLLLDSAVWLCVDDEVVHKLDTLCLGNLDGGPGTAAYVARLLGAAGAGVSGGKAVRLSLDEAFFMAYALDLLTVHDVVEGRAVALDTTALWQRLQHARRDFFLLYLAYHHFRSKGWIPRTGLQYGADFVLYQRHPALTHSDYAVLIVPLPPAGSSSGSSSSGDGGGGSGSSSVAEQERRPELGWHDMQISNRLSAQVSKKLLLFYVQDQSGSGDRSTPNCLSKMAVHERLVRRWVPESHRPPPQGGK